MGQLALQKITMFLSTGLEVVEARVPAQRIVDKPRRLKVSVAVPGLRPLGLDKVAVLCFVLCRSRRDSVLRLVMGPSLLNLGICVTNY